MCVFFPFVSHSLNSTDSSNILYISAVDVPLPVGKDSSDCSFGDASLEHMSGLDPATALCEDVMPFGYSIVWSVIHNGVVRRARHMPQMPCIVATRSSHDNICIFDGRSPNGAPTASLSQHDEGGWGLDWNPLHKGLLVSGSDDGQIGVWDVQSCLQSGAPSPRSSRVTSMPLYSFTSGVGSVYDIQWNPFQQHLFGTAIGKGVLKLWDTRERKAVLDLQTHSTDIMCMAYSPHFEHYLASASAEGTVRVWDARRMELNNPLLDLREHEGGVLSLTWNAHKSSANMLLSAGEDHRCFLWDVSGGCASAHFAKDSLDDGMDDHLLFIHGGHTAAVQDVSFSPSQRNLVASVAEDNILQVWRMNIDIAKECGTVPFSQLSEDQLRNPPRREPEPEYELSAKSKSSKTSKLHSGNDLNGKRKSPASSSSKECTFETSLPSPQGSRKKKIPKKKMSRPLSMLNPPVAPQDGVSAMQKLELLRNVRGKMMGVFKSISRMVQWKQYIFARADMLLM